MAIIKEPDYEMEVQIDQVEVNEELGRVAEHKDVTRWVLGVRMLCKTCEEEMCFDNGWHAGHIFTHTFTEMVVVRMSNVRLSRLYF